MTIESAKAKRVKRILEAVASEINGKFREEYSGRGMYGKECLGIVCEDDTECIEAVASRGLSGAKVDNMGLKYIVYYPNPELNEDEGDDEE